MNEVLMISGFIKLADIKLNIQCFCSEEIEIKR